MLRLVSVPASDYDEQDEILGLFEGDVEAAWEAFKQAYPPPTPLPEKYPSVPSKKYIAKHPDAEANYHRDAKAYEAAWAAREADRLALQKQWIAEGLDAHQTYPDWVSLGTVFKTWITKHPELGLTEVEADFFYLGHEYDR